MTTNDIRTVVERALELDKKRTQGEWRVDSRNKSIVRPDYGIDWIGKGYLGDAEVLHCQVSNMAGDHETNAQFIAAATEWPTAMAEMMQVIELCRESLTAAGRYMDAADPNVMTASKIRNALSSINKLSASAQGE